MTRRAPAVLGALLLVAAGCARERPPDTLFHVAPSSAACAWFQELRTLYPDLQASSFTPSGTDQLQPLGDRGFALWEEDAPAEEIAVHKALAEVSPDGSRAVSLYWECLSKLEDGWERPYGNPDSYITVLSTKTWAGAPAFVCGTLCRFHAAGWAGNDTVIVVGAYGDQPDTRVLEIGVADLSQGLLRWYHGPKVSTEMDRKIEDLWWSWLRRRYPQVPWAPGDE